MARKYNIGDEEEDNGELGKQNTGAENKGVKLNEGNTELRKKKGGCCGGGKKKKEKMKLQQIMKKKQLKKVNKKENIIIKIII